MFSRTIMTMILCGGIVLGTWSCQTQERAGEMEASGAMEESGAMEDETMGMGMEMPDTIGSALWSYLESMDYRANWALWPGKGELYQGREPHGMLLTTYLSPSAYEALTGVAGAMPAGAIIVKENYMPDSTLAATTVMYKVDSYDPQHNNWFWLKRLADGTIEVQGRGAGCIACHSAESSNDYLFTGSLGGGEM
jgi:hypothetical protein